MEKAYKKAIDVIESCITSRHTLTAYNYIWLFKKLFNGHQGCDELTRRLHAQCSRKRKILESKR
tara:strand:- start:2482 stop:2673 length:192 start_codon:yes stop_codon:yes gene_type:complete